VEVAGASLQRRGEQKLGGVVVSAHSVQRAQLSRRMAVSFGWLKLSYLIKNY
jgi:hypothetical protein